MYKNHKIFIKYKLLNEIKNKKMIKNKTFI